MIKRFAPIYAAASVLALTTVLATSAATPLLAQDAASKISKAQAGFVRIKVGDVEVTALSDGTIPVDTGLLIIDHKNDLKKIPGKIVRQVSGRHFGQCLPDQDVRQVDPR